MGLLQRFIVGRIQRYQRRGGGVAKFRVECNFEPGCSEYTRQAVESFGVIRGLRLALKRIRRCRQPDLPCKIPDPLTAEDGQLCSKPGRSEPMR